MRENYKSWTINCEQPTITRLEKGYLLEASSWRLDIEYIINDVIIQSQERSFWKNFKSIINFSTDQRVDHRFNPTNYNGIDIDKIVLNIYRNLLSWMRINLHYQRFEI